MKKAVLDVKKDNNIFKQNWLQYVILFLGLDLINQFVIIPIFRYLTTEILQASAIPVISYQNAVNIIVHHTFAFLLLVVELIILIITIYGEFSFLLVAINNIKNNSFTFKKNWRQTLQALKQIKAGSLLLLLGYFILIVPFADLVYRTSLLAKIQIPQFIMDYMARNIWLAIGLTIFYVVAFVVGLRLILTLPLMVYQKMKTRQAMKISWQLTKNRKWWDLLERLIIVAIISTVILVAGYGIIFLCQLGLDKITPISYLSASFNMLLIQALAEIVYAWSAMMGLTFVIQRVINNPQVDKPKAKKKSFYIFSGIVILILVVTAAINNAFYLKDIDLTAPVVISHRGVNNHNGVQNSIAALKKTVKLKPDYVEIDLHETKDNQFVVMHDENLLKLAGVNKMPKDLTLKQLTKLTIREDGHKAKIASFDQYLKAAKKYNQKLLIEIKTTSLDSKKMLNNFNKKYGQTILKNKYQVQSLDYQAVEKLHQLNPKLFIIYIQPYNFTYPHSVADGYSMEYSTLNNDFVWQSHLQHHCVYAWTVNTKDIIRRMVYINVDGLITDNVKLAKKTIEEMKKSGYAGRLWNYIAVLPTMTNFE